MRTISCGIVVVRKEGDQYLYLLLKSYNYFDMPKGKQDPGETDLQTALRETWEEADLDAEDLKFKWGHDFHQTDPYGKNKVARYFLAETTNDQVKLKVNPELGKPEHEQYGWFSYEQASKIVGARIQKVLDWARDKLEDTK